MEAGLDSIRQQLWLQTGGSAGAGGGAASGGGRLQPFSCSLGQLPTGTAAAGSGATVSSAGGGACGGACGGASGSAGGGAGCGAGAGAASGGGRLQPFTCSLGRLPTGAVVVLAAVQVAVQVAGLEAVLAAGLLMVLAAVQVAVLAVVLVPTRPSPAASDG
ncbi:hypothetical protein NDU88_005945 [Pleurodeles waltl]|uniref:Uncharacterized protein n=1 Tax=Pleurodeles waltl TaxID=8319 RepID=A0AAV7NWQ6_PLEWA|nr:hypothetical protein NDU88_005945 [Pleurodeles waltl]